LLIVIAVDGNIAFDVDAVTCAVVQPHSEAGSGAGIPAAQSVSEAERRKHREKFFSGDPEHNVHGG
jgi:hypothetical protein